MTDQQRYDCIGYAASSKVPTPHMDRIAQGMVFSQCQTVNPICQPARTALLTGRYPHQIGTVQMSGDLNFATPTFPQALQKAGYWTAGIGKFHYLQSWPWHTPVGGGVPLTKLRSEMQALGYHRVWETSGKQLACKNYCDYCEYLDERGLLSGFRDWVEERGANSDFPNAELEKDGVPWPFDEADHIDKVTGRKIRDAIEQRDQSKPFFILGSFCSPHKPFDPPQRFLDMEPYEEVDDFIPSEAGPLSEEQKQVFWKLRRAYKATIRLLDEEIGKILDQLESDGLLEDTLIIISSDHGEMMGDHGCVQKSSYYRESLNVPLAIRHPQFLNHSCNDRPVELTDITATILAAAGLDPRSALSKNWPAFNNSIPCKSLLPVLSGTENSIREYAFSECRHDWQCITSSKYKYIKFLGYDDPDVGPREQFFDLENDPSEVCNLITDTSYADAVDWHRRRLQFVLDQTPAVQHRWAPLMSSS
tara:strand:- start:4262 stop:5689 length:1428 start_codon:yes stop_codon:yes gene_type:complete